MTRIVLTLLLGGALALAACDRPDTAANATTGAVASSNTQDQADAATTADDVVDDLLSADTEATSDDADETSADDPASDDASEDADAETPTAETSDTETDDEVADDAADAETDETADGDSNAATPDAETDEAASGDEGEGENEAGSADYTVPEGYSLTPFLSEEQVQNFDAAEDVLEPGKDYLAVIETSAGTIVADLFEEQVPNTVNNFVFLARNHYYDGIVFHRVLENFMAQTGDPTGTGTSGPGYQFEDEFTDDLVHDEPGVLSMANSGPNTNGSQFFITFTATPHLDGLHSVFGKVTEGLDVLDNIKRVDPSGGAGSQPDIIVMFDDSVADLRAQGVDIEGDDAQTVEDFLNATLDDGIPEAGGEFELAGYRAVTGRMGADLALGLFSDSLLSDSEGADDGPSVMERVYIVEKERDDS